ncbi:helix-turn-helix domain-containing protein [Winogradskyella aurantia]|uniref:Transcriptional regulator n=1 Tax=Winogradskyella aurantia TaxID=1915063 RepID=A0A265UTA8_9FLAO|nr:helix-turn-helix transcriptional regulator [Winogradskyella aurantia]OZV68548.1 transcriptional regulator [Winogradskyella aurantia]
MINSGEFAKRLQKVIDHYDETASGFAERIGVQRSSISHILSGRNKPSLDFVMKVLGAYPEVELYWLLNGKGFFPPNSSLSNIQTDPLESNTTQHSRLPIEPKSNTEIEKIVIFFKDGTFKSYTP